jgi:hypothetical protein
MNHADKQLKVEQATIRSAGVQCPGRKEDGEIWKFRQEPGEEYCIVQGTKMVPVVPCKRLDQGLKCGPGWRRQIVCPDGVKAAASRAGGLQLSTKLQQAS